MENWVYLKGGLEMKRTGCERRMKPRQGSDQGSKFNSAAPVYRGKNHKTHPLFQLDYVAKQAQRALSSSKFLWEAAGAARLMSPSGLLNPLWQALKHQDWGRAVGLGWYLHIS